MSSPPQLSLKPRVEVRPATPVDVPSMYAIRRSAFASGPISRALYNNSEVPTAVDIAHGERRIASEMTAEKNTYLVAVLANTSSQGGEAIVAYAKWVEYLQDRPAEEWNTPLEVSRESAGPDVNLAVVEAFSGGLREMKKREIGGRAHLLLSLLATSPDHQRLGAGSLLVRWGVERARTLNATRLTSLRPLNCYLEASPAGYSMYARHGFEDIAVLDVDLTGRFGIAKTEADIKDTKSWGGEYGLGLRKRGDANCEQEADLKEGFYRTVLMVRKP